MSGSAAAPDDLPDGRQITAFHDACIESQRWPDEAAPARPGTRIWDFIEENHQSNARLWREEDLARRRLAPDSEIVANKRAIDGLNQRRNDAIERLDDIANEVLGVNMEAAPRLHSETPGMMVDRLSILALKIRAMGAEAVRLDADDAHRARCAAMLSRLRLQRDDLAGCLDALLADCRTGRARFKLYRQFKMYNDPELNPSVYGEPKRRD